MRTLTPVSAHEALSETQSAAEQRVAVDQTWEDCFDSLRQYGQQLPPEFADTKHRSELGDNIFRIPRSDNLGVQAVRFSTETVMGFMSKHALYDRTHTLVVPDDSDKDPLYTTRVVDCDIQCVPHDFLLKIRSIELLKHAPTVSDQDRWLNIAGSIGHMLYAISPENGSDGNEPIPLAPGRIIIPMEPNPRQIERVYKKIRRDMANAR